MPGERRCSNSECNVVVSAYRYAHDLPYVLIERSQIGVDERFEVDSKDKKPGNRKHVVTKKFSRSSHLEKPQWSPAQVLETGCGGLEVATFDERAFQDAHIHYLATEIYTVLEGEMEMRLGGDLKVLRAGDEVIVLPGTAHEVFRATNFLTRLHAINCHGTDDKVVVTSLRPVG